MTSYQDELKPITGSDRILIASCWEQVRKDVKGNANDLFLRFFKENPSYQKRFKSFADIPYEQLSGNKRLVAHASNVLYAISALVDHLGDEEIAAEMLLKVARSHHGRQINVTEFENLGKTLLGFLQEKLPEMMNEEATAAWTRLWTAVLAIMGRAFGAMDKGIEHPM